VMASTATTQPLESKCCHRLLKSNPKVASWHVHFVGDSWLALGPSIESFNSCRVALQGGPDAI